MDNEQLASELLKIAKALTASVYYHAELEEDSIDGFDMDAIADRTFLRSDFGFDGWVVFSDNLSDLKEFVEKAEKDGAVVVGRIKRAPHNLYPL